MTDQQARKFDVYDKACAGAILTQKKLKHFYPPVKVHPVGFDCAVHWKFRRKSFEVSASLYGVSMNGTAPIFSSAELFEFRYVLSEAEQMYGLLKGQLSKEEL